METLKEGPLNKQDNKQDNNRMKQARQQPNETRSKLVEYRRHEPITVSGPVS